MFAHKQDVVQEVEQRAGSEARNKTWEGGMKENKWESVKEMIGSSEDLACFQVLWINCIKYTVHF